MPSGRTGSWAVQGGLGTERVSRLARALGVRGAEQEGPLKPEGPAQGVPTPPWRHPWLSRRCSEAQTAAGRVIRSRLTKKEGGSSPTSQERPRPTFGGRGQGHGGRGQGQESSGPQAGPRPWGGQCWLAGLFLQVHRAWGGGGALPPSRNREDPSPSGRSPLGSE